MHFQYAFLIARKKYAFQYAFLMAPRFSQNMHFPWENAYICIFLGWLRKMLTSSIVQINVSRIFDSSIFVSEICTFPLENAYFFAFRLAAENAYFIVR